MLGWKIKSNDLNKVISQRKKILSLQKRGLLEQKLISKKKDFVGFVNYLEVVVSMDVAYTVRLPIDQIDIWVAEPEFR